MSFRWCISYPVRCVTSRETTWVSYRNYSSAQCASDIRVITPLSTNDRYPLPEQQLSSLPRVCGHESRTGMPWLDIRCSTQVISLHYCLWCPPAPVFKKVKSWLIEVKKISPRRSQRSFASHVVTTNGFKHIMTLRRNFKPSDSCEDRSTHGSL